jgi:hypothetical protein
MNYSICLLVLLLLPGVWCAFLWSAHNMMLYTRIIMLIGIGTIIGMLCSKWIFRRFPVIGTFFHESAHAIAAMFMFRRILNFIVTKNNGGQVFHSAGFGEELGDHFIGLAPYAFPWLTMICVLLRPLWDVQILIYYDCFTGFTFGLHIISAMREFKLNWTKHPFISASNQFVYTDIGRRGYFPSCLFITIIILTSLGIINSLLVRGYPGVWEWFILAGNGSINLLIKISSMLTSFVVR